MPLNVLDVLKQQYQGKPTSQEGYQSELLRDLAAGEGVTVPPPEPPGVLSQLLSGVKATPETLGAALTGTLAFPISGIAGTLAAPFVGLERAGSEVIPKVQEALTYAPRGETAQKSVELLNKPFEIVHESADWWGQKVNEATGVPELGALTATLIEAGILFAGPGTIKKAVNIKLGKGDLLKLRRKLSTAERTGDFSSTELSDTLRDIFAQAKNDPALMADIERYVRGPRDAAATMQTAQGGVSAATREVLNRGKAPQLTAPGVGGAPVNVSETGPIPTLLQEGRSSGIPMGAGEPIAPQITLPERKLLAAPKKLNSAELVKQRIERRRMAEVAGVELEVPRMREVPLTEVEKVKPQSAQALPQDIFPELPPVDYEFGLRLDLQEGQPGAEAWARTRQRIKELRAEEAGLDPEVVRPEPEPEILPEMNSTMDAIEFGKVATEEQIAEIRDRQKTYSNQAEQLLKDGKFDEALQAGYKAQFDREVIESREKTGGFAERGAEPTSPKKPKKSRITFKSQAKKHGLDFEGEYVYEESGESVGRYYDPVTQDYFEANTPKEVATELELHRERKATQTEQFEGMSIDNFRNVAEEWARNPVKGGGKIIIDKINEFLESKSNLPNAELTDLVSDAENIIGEINKIRKRRGDAPVAIDDMIEKPLVNPELPDIKVAETIEKLNDGSIGEPKILSKEDRIAYMKEWSKKKSKLKQREVEALIEQGEDISSMLPDETQDAYRAYKELQDYSIESSEARGVGEVLYDLVDLFGDERGSFSLESLSFDQKMALQRLVADAKRLKADLAEFLKEHGFTPEQVALIRKQINDIRKVEPETFGEPRQVWIDARAIANGDAIVKQRKTRGLNKPPVYASELAAVLEAKELPYKKFGGFENPLRTIEEIDPRGNGIKQFYYDYREAEQLLRREIESTRSDIKQLRKGISWAGRKRIGAYAIAQQERGKFILKKMKVEVPTLNETEIAAYHALRDRFETLFERINKTRELIGKEPIEKVDNYFTFFRAFGIMEKAGFTTNMLLDKPSIIHSRYANYGSTPFRFGIERIKKGALPVELDAFDIYEKYSNIALRHIHLSPWVAKMRELLTSLPDPKTGKLTWKMEVQKPNLYNFLSNWTNHIAGYPSNWQLPRVYERALNRINKNLAFSVLGANARSMLVQPAAMVNTIAEIGFKHSGQGILATMEDVFKSGENRKFALKNSKVLDGRAFDASFEDAAKAIRGGQIGAAQETLGRWALKPLQWLDMETAIASWNGAYKLAIERGMSLRDAINFADDVVTRTQGSALPGDLAPIQRSTLGKTFTLFQTFTINNWGFLTRDVLGLGNVKITNDIALRKVMRYVAAAAAFNAMYEYAGIQSPLPTPIKSLRDSLDENAGLPTTAGRLAMELIEQVPVIGSTKYGTSIGGPTVEAITKAVQSLRGAPLSRPIPESLGTFTGIPGVTQAGKTVRAHKRGESIYGQIIGRYEPETSTGGSQRRGLGGLKGLGGLSGLGGL